MKKGIRMIVAMILVIVMASTVILPTLVSLFAK